MVGKIPTGEGHCENNDGSNPGQRFFKHVHSPVESYVNATLGSVSSDVSAHWYRVAPVETVTQGFSKNSMIIGPETLKI
jgi:hypothetical protein